MDLDYDYIMIVFRFLYSNYDEEKRRQQKEGEEAAANEANNNDDTNDTPITYTSTRNITELMEEEASDLTTEETVRLDLNKFDEGALKCHMCLNITRSISHSFSSKHLSLSLRHV